MSLDLTLLVAGQSQPSASVNEIANIIEASLASTVTVDANGDADYTLDTSTGNPPFEWQNFQVIVTNGGAAWTAQRNINVPAEAKLYLFYNNNGAAFNANFQVTGGAGVGQTAGNGQRTLLYCDGTDMIQLIAPF